MGRFYKTTGGQFKDFMYQPDFESAKLAAQGEIKKAASEEALKRVGGMQQKDQLKGWDESYNTSITDFNERLESANSSTLI